MKTLYVVDTRIRKTAQNWKNFCEVEKTSVTFSTEQEMKNYFDSLEPYENEKIRERVIYKGINCADVENGRCKTGDNWGSWTKHLPGILPPSML